MNALRLGEALSIIGMAGVVLAAPSYADDQALQAILQKLRCVPSQVTHTELAAGLVSYEVTCKGRADAVFVVCQGTDCRHLTKRSNNLENEAPPQ